MPVTELIERIWELTAWFALGAILCLVLYAVGRDALAAIRNAFRGNHGRRDSARRTGQAAGRSMLR